jgi:hypothetical protein
MRLKVLITVKVFWIVMPCGLVDRYQRFEEHTPSVFSIYESGQGILFIFLLHVLRLSVTSNFTTSGKRNYMSHSKMTGNSAAAQHYILASRGKSFRLSSAVCVNLFS